MNQYISFRDPKGFIVDKGDHYLRYINFSYEDDYRHLMDSGLYDCLLRERLIIDHSEQSLSNEEVKLFYKIICPRRIKFTSYPVEWSSKEWIEVILAYLRINLIALRFGMILKDANPYNFCIENGYPLLLDTLSFQKFEEGDAWISYKQFCHMMLAPGALFSFTEFKTPNDISFSTDGLNLRLISKLLPKSSWFNMSLLLHIHLHSFFSNQYIISNRKRPTPFFSKQKLITLIEMLHKSINRWKYLKKKSQWSNYYTVDIESSQYLDKKKKIVDEVLYAYRPQVVFDLGANKGEFSKIAIAAGARVVSIDYDEACISQFVDEIQQSKLSNISTVVGDITSPTASTGLMNREHRSLLDRLGTADMVLGLALIHHLSIANNIPLSLVADLFNRLTNRFVLMEFIPKNDEKVLLLLTSREDVFIDYSEDRFKIAFSNYFNLLKSITIDGSKRKLYLWEKK